MTMLRIATTIVFLVAGFHSAQAGPPLSDTGQQSATHYRETLNRYCVSCHNKVLRTAGMVLETVNVADVRESPEVWERVITKLSLSAMPPVGVPHPDASFYKGFLAYLQTELDQAEKQNPNPGRPTVHRLNRTEYANAVRDLLAVEIDAAALLPADNIGKGFDNIADVLAVSPLLMERYLFAAGRIASLAVGPATMAPAAASISRKTHSSRIASQKSSENCKPGSENDKAPYRYNDRIPGCRISFCSGRAAVERYPGAICHSLPGNAQSLLRFLP